MDGREVACFPGEMGLPLGQSQERASPFLAKFVQSACFATGRDAVYAVSGAPLALVLQAATSRVKPVTPPNGAAGPPPANGPAC
jgi:hypothetical protein